MPRPSEGVLVGSLRVREESGEYRIGAVARVST